MEKISDFFSELKERISNPFILSYLIGWCIWNYEIVVGLLFYKASELKADGYVSYLDLIKKNSSTHNFLWLPLSSAIIYTFVFPFIKNLILAFGSWIDTWGGNWTLSISKTRKVSSEKYLKYKIQYEQAIEKISKFANDEHDFNTKLSDAENARKTLNEALELAKQTHEKELLELNNSKEGLKRQLHKWELSNSNNVIAGEWFLEIVNYEIGFNGVKSNRTEKFKVTVSSGQIIMTKEDNTSSTSNISSVFANSKFLIIYLNKASTVPVNFETDERWIFEVSFYNGIQKLSGTNRMGASIQLRRKVNTDLPIDQIGEK